MHYMFVGDPNAKNKRLEPEEITLVRPAGGPGKPSLVQVFPRNEPVDVIDDYLLKKLAGNNHFVACHPDGRVIDEGVTHGDLHGLGAGDAGAAEAGRLGGRGKRAV